MARSKKKIRAEIIEVSNVRELDWGIVFDLVINGVKLYSCRLVEGRNGDFVSFPSYKGKNGKYYTHCYFDLNDDETQEIVEAVDKSLK